MREGIYYQPDNTASGTSSWRCHITPDLCTGFTVHYYKSPGSASSGGLIVRPFTSCSLAWVISEALCLKSNANLEATDIPLFRCEPVQLFEIGATL